MKTTPPRMAGGHPSGYVHTPRPTDALVCPACGGTAFRTTHTRPRPGLIRRRRVCRACGQIMYTRECAERPERPAHPEHPERS